VVEWRFHPNPGIDLAIAVLNGPIPNAVSVGYGAPPAYPNVVTHVGNGIFGDPSNPSYHTYDGNRRGFRASVRQIFGGASGYSDTYNFETEFFSDQSDPLCGKLTTWDSGGGVYDQATGRQVGIMAYQIGGYYNYGSTGILDLGVPEIKDWILSEAAAILTEKTPQLQNAPATNGMMVSWDAKAIGFTLQVSEDLQTWTDVGTTITAPGSYHFIPSGGKGFARLNYTAVTVPLVTLPP